MLARRLLAALAAVAAVAACESNSDQGGPGTGDTGPTPQNCSCDGIECGSNQCGESCGTCPGWDACVEGHCVARCPNGVCEPQFNEDCESCPQDCTEGCAVGPCPGECSAGATDEKACGKCGKAKRTCGSNCAWGIWGTCQGQGECASGTDGDSEPCGNCGTRTRSCDGECHWSWGGCMGEGDCTPGTVSTQGCPANASKTCLQTCQWPASCEYCAGQGDCMPNEKGKTEACGKCGSRQQICSSSCKWAWGGCTGEGTCSPDDSQSCTKIVSGTSCSGTQACTDSCAWGTCVPSDPACGTAQKVTTTFSVTNDCVVEYEQLDSSSTDDENQDGAVLKVGFEDESDSQYTWWLKYRTFLFFDDITGIPSGATVNKATLRLYVNKLKGQTGWNVQVKHANGSWGEGSITWDNQPSLSNSGSIEVSAPKATGWFDIDLTAYVQDVVDGSVSYHGDALKSDKEGSAGNGIDAMFLFDDKPGAYAPKLDIEYTYTP